MSCLNSSASIWQMLHPRHTPSVRTFLRCSKRRGASLLSESVSSSPLLFRRLEPKWASLRSLRRFWLAGLISPRSSARSELGVRKPGGNAASGPAEASSTGRHESAVNGAWDIRSKSSGNAGGYAGSKCLVPLDLCLCGLRRLESSISPSVWGWFSLGRTVRPGAADTARGRVSWPGAGAAPPELAAVDEAPGFDRLSTRQNGEVNGSLWLSSRGGDRSSGAPAALVALCVRAWCGLPPCRCLARTTAAVRCVARTTA